MDPLPSPDRRPIQRPIFIVGTVRSGTTLLARCLDTHPEIVWAQSEEGGLELAAEWYALAGVEIGVPRVPTERCPAVAETVATDRVRRRVQEDFAERLARQGDPATDRFLNKLPHFWNKLPFLRAIFPDACLIVTSRDLRSTVLSTQVLWLRDHRSRNVQYYLPEGREWCWTCLRNGPGDLERSRLFPGGDPAVIAEYWLRVYETIVAEAAGFEMVVFVRHRDLVRDPLATLARICSELGLAAHDWQIPLLDPHRNDRWRTLLTTRERNRLETFVAANRQRILGLPQVDTTL